jgi:hypothetical protein
VSWPTHTGPVRRDPASSDIVVVRHGGQVGLRGGQLIARMPYPVNLSGLWLTSEATSVAFAAGPLRSGPVGVSGGCQSDKPISLETPGLNVATHRFATTVGITRSTTKLAETSLGPLAARSHP